MLTRENLFKYLQKQGTYRLHPLFLMLQHPLGDYVPISDLKNEHVNAFKKALESWNLYVLQRDNIIEFQNISRDDWIPINDFIAGRIFDITPESVDTYQKDNLRIKPEITNVIAEMEEYLLFRSFFYTNHRPLLLHQDPVKQPIINLIRILLPLFQFYGAEVEITVDKIQRIISHGLFNKLRPPINHQQIKTTLQEMVNSPETNFTLLLKSEEQLVIRFPTNQLTVQQLK